MTTDATARTTASHLDAIDKIFHARSIAIVGATERAGYGARFVSTLQKTSYSGRIYPINPSRPEVFGLPCYSSPSALPETPDLVAVIVPAERVLASLRECATLGTKAAIVISAGAAVSVGARLVTRRASWPGLVVALVVAAGLIWPTLRYSMADARSFPNGAERAYASLGRWFAVNTPPDASVGYLEIGIIGYHSRRTIIDPLGLVNPGVAPHVAQRQDRGPAITSGCWPSSAHVGRSPSTLAARRAAPPDARRTSGPWVRPPASRASGRGSASRHRGLRRLRQPLRRSCPCLLRSARRR